MDNTDANLRLRKTSPEAAKVSEVVSGRVLEQNTCPCNDNDEAAKEVTTIRLITPGGEGNYFDYNAGRYRRRVDAFYKKTGIKVEIVTVAGLDEINSEMLEDAGKGVYDGYSFIPNVIGAVVDANGLADLTEYAAGNEDIRWTDILPFQRENSAAYGGAVRSLPCDGDIHSLFYRKDLFEQYNLQPPRTWDEYTERAAFFHGMEVPAADGNGTVTLSGSCVERTKKCDVLRNYMFMQVHAATAQSQGFSKGLMFDSASFKPNLREGMAETLRHLENQVKYGVEEEMADDGCRDVNIANMHAGTCAMTYYWGDVFSRHLYEGSKVEGKLGVSITPGVTKVLDIDTGKLVPCDEDTCPYGVDYPDIGRVNHAPFAAAGGWSAGVAGGLPKEREVAMAAFIGFVCGKEESLKDVITDARSKALATGADPFRKSHFDVEKWVAQGYPRNATKEYLATVTNEFASPNIVVDTRFSQGLPLNVAMGLRIYDHLMHSKTRTMTHEERMDVSMKIEEDWNAILADFDKRRPVGSLPMSARYQQSLNVYVPPEKMDTNAVISTKYIVSLVVGCSLLVGIISGLVIYSISQRKLKEQQMLAAEELAAKRRREADEDSDVDSIVGRGDERDEIEEIHKLAKNETKRIKLWRGLLLFVYVGSTAASVIISHLALDGKRLEISATHCTIMMAVLAATVGGCFLLYDRSIQLRTKLIVANAARANAVVTSMFPSQFRDQMIADREENEENTKMFRGSHNKMKAFLASGDNHEASQKPLADLFLETTTLFADIVGFTPWSSAREATQVFALLESVFFAFDVLAARRGIFKVETVGDCYVAVSGLPDPRKDHAPAMARFAIDILNKMATLTRDLEVSLGPDTSALSLRIGMHSGPVTGGVLRGARSRFQLFGDTMNTTARIESSGSPDRIHVSEECASLLMASGKGFELEKRKNVVVAKGKGPIQTYWLKARSGKGRGDTSHSPSDLSIEDPSDALAAAPAQRQERLIRWNVDQLVTILKQVVARRNAETVTSNRTQAPAETYKIIKDGASLLDDVKEIIELPEYNEKVVAQQADPESIVISKKVLGEMYHFVSAVCATYRANAFHNFEHCSAVSMSVLKLLSRIVAPADTDDGNAATLHDHTYGITSDPLTQFACVFSALIHDADHPGVSNSILVQEKSPVAIEYGNRSVAEQRSLVVCWDMLMQDEYTEFRKTLCATQSELDRFRSLVVNAVLATDIVDKDLKTLRNARWDRAFKQVETSRFGKENARDATNRRATIIIEHLIQASDVSHTMQHWHIYRKWNERFFRECYASFKAGRAETDPSQNWYGNEIGFFDFYIIPLAKKLKDCGVFGKSSDEFLNYAIQNRAEWEARGQEVVSNMMETIAEEEAAKRASNLGILVDI